MQGIVETARGLLHGRNLMARVARAAVWLAGAAGADRLARFARTIILVRLLAREDFGLMASAVAVSTAFEAFSEVGVRQCVIQHRDGAQNAFLNAAWWFSAVRGAALFGAGWLAAPWISSWMKSPDSLLILRIVLLSLLFNGVVSPRVHVLEKRLDFRKWVLLRQGPSLLGIVLTVVLAVFYRTAVVLAAGLVAESALRVRTAGSTSR